MDVTVVHKPSTHNIKVKKHSHLITHDHPTYEIKHTTEGYTVSHRPTSYDLKVKRVSQTIEHKPTTYSINAGGRRGEKGDPGRDGRVYEVKAGDGIIVDNSDPANPVVHSAGGSGDKNYTQDFTDRSFITVTHNLLKYPAVSVFDSSGQEVVGSVDYLDLNRVRLDFSAPFSGRVTLN